jgi:DNA-binding NarL/FixJ family response regulator/class 3 adenylate cyclase
VTDELPTGTVTFLFSDIEGSTALLRRLRERYADVLDEHHRLLRAAFSEHGGYEVATEGDSFFVAFSDPGAALVAAASAQRALAAHGWPTDAEVRVRIGIHTGPVTVSDGRYVGLAVHRAARICGAGEGGQVLVSQATRTLLDDHEPEVVGLTLNDLGERTLKDFDRPVRIYEVVTTDRPPAEPRVRVLIADDQALVRTGFRMILEAEKDIEVVGDAADGAEALAAARRLRPDVVLMDVRMPELDGIEATRRLLADEAAASKVVMLTTFDMDEYVYEALRAGASGFLLKDVPPEQLVVGIRSVASGEALLAPSVTRRVVEEFVRRPPESARPAPPELEELTERELEVLKLVARGLSNAEIAKELFVSDATVKTHVARILMKLALRDRVQAVVYAYEHAVVRPSA